MAPRSRPRGAWADSGRVEWRKLTGNDTVSLHGAEVFFDAVPLGGGDTVDLTVKLGGNDRGDFVILGLRMDKPMNARRLKGLPLEAIRIESSRVMTEANNRYVTPVFRLSEAVGLSEYSITARSSAKRLKEMRGRDRHSPEFLAFVAETVRDARKRGIGGWRAVADALSYPDGTPISRAMAQRHMQAARDAGNELGVLSRTTDEVSPIQGLVEDSDPN